MFNPKRIFRHTQRNTSSRTLGTHPDPNSFCCFPRALPWAGISERLWRLFRWEGVFLDQHEALGGIGFDFSILEDCQNGWDPESELAGAIGNSI